MSSQLTVLAYYSRKIIKIGIISLIAIIVLYPIGRAGLKAWREAHPPPPPEPNTAFGKIPAVKFGLEKSDGLSLRSETVQGNLPNLANQGRVYFIPILGPKFFDPDKTRQKAKMLGFDIEKGKISSNRFLFLDSDNNAVLKIDTINNNFRIDYPWQNDLFFLNSSPPTQKAALQTARSTLSRINLWHDDYAPEKTEYIFIRYDEEKNELVEALSYSEGQLIKVNLFRRDRDNLAVLPPNPKESNTSFILSRASGSKKIIFGKHYYFKVNYDKFATYPLKTSTAAWEELSSGEGYIAQMGDNDPSNTIVVRDVSLAYFDPETPQSFLQPIFVFHGDNDFLAYVPALDPTWVEK